MWPVCAMIIQTVSALRIDRCESTALGMESGLIADAQITASSSFDQQSVGAQNARIRSELASGAWCPKSQIHGSSYEFLQINLRNTYVVTAVETQGRYGNGTGREYTSEYMIDYLRPGSKWIRYRNRSGHTLITGNADTTSAVMRSLDPPLLASKVRIVPHSKLMRTVCLRLELYGCRHEDGLLYYSTLPGGSHVGELDFRDSTFENSDLYTETGIRRGLGLLSDGYVAETSPFDEANRNGSWIGWSRAHSDGTVTLLFEFDQLRNFSEILMVAYGRPNNIDVIFSQDGSNFSLSSQISSLSTRPANSSGERHDLRIPLHKRMAKKIRVTISFAADWMFLTEVHFSSDRLYEAPIGYNLLYNESPTARTLQEDGDFSPASTYGAIGAISMLALMLVILCVVARRKRKPENKSSIFEKDIRKDLIITQIRGKTITGLLPSPQTTSYLESNSHWSDKTTTTSFSSKSASPKIGAATWNDFYFPPPPSLTDEIDTTRSNALQPLPFIQTKKCQSDDLSRKQAQLVVDKVPRIPSSSILAGVELGQGKYTVVSKCLIPIVGAAAYKTAKNDRCVLGRNALLNELNTLARAKNQHIINLLAVDDSNGLLLELATNGNVRQYLHSLTAQPPVGKLLGFCADVCEGMRHLESLGLIHGHLTPCNILLSGGLRAKVSSPRGSSHHAQLRYSAPESILKNTFSTSSDAWAFAVCCWEIVETSCTRIPFGSLSNKDIVANAQRMLTFCEDRAVLSFSDAAPRGVRDVLVRCFEVDPKARPTFAQIASFMRKFYINLK